MPLVVIGSFVEAVVLYGLRIVARLRESERLKAAQHRTGYEQAA